MSQFPQLTSNLSTANFRASVLTKLISGIEISNDSENPIPVTISGSSGATDYELVVSTYTCKTAFVGASVGDIITQTQVIGITAGVASTLTTIWRNQTTAIDLVSAPSSANLSLDGTTALTQAQLQAMTVAATQSGTWNVGVNNFPTSTEISNDVGNPVPVSGTVSASNTAFIATRPTGAVTASGGTVSSGTPVALTGSFTKMLVVQNTSTTGTLYVSTNAIPSATNGISLSAGVGYEFLHIPSSVIYVSASVGAITYGYIYA